MVRVAEAEAVVAQDLAGLAGLTTVPMFAGLSWMLRGNLLCAVSHEGLLVRLGREKEAWAATLAGVGPMMMGARPMRGWMRLHDIRDAGTRQVLLAAAQEFVGTLPPK